MVVPELELYLEWFYLLLFWNCRHLYICFYHCLNEFFYALIFSSTQSSKTLSVLVEEFSSKFGEDYVLMSTAGVLASLPPVVLALIFQKYIVQGLTAGSVKG